MGTAWNPGTGASAGWVEFPEDGEQLDHDLDRWGASSGKVTRAAARGEDRLFVFAASQFAVLPTITRGQGFDERPLGYLTSVVPCTRNLQLIATLSVRHVNRQKGIKERRAAGVIVRLGDAERVRDRRERESEVVTVIVFSKWLCQKSKQSWTALVRVLNPGARAAGGRRCG